jgi:hypothetical protein
VRVVDDVPPPAVEPVVGEPESTRSVAVPSENIGRVPIIELQRVLGQLLDRLEKVAA